MIALKAQAHRVLVSFFVFAIAGVNVGASEDGCRKGFEALKSYKRTWGERVDAEKKPDFCQSVANDARGHAPAIPKDCDELEMSQLSAEFQGEINGFGVVDGVVQSPMTGSVSTVLKQERDQISEVFKAKCQKRLNDSRGSPRSPAPGTSSGASSTAGSAL